MKLPKFSKKIIIPTLAAATVLGGGSALALQTNSQPDIAPTQEVRENVEVKQKDTQTTQAAIDEQATPEVQENAVPSEEQVEEPQTNPYIEGMNIWHIWNRRTAVGLTMPEGPSGDGSWCALALQDDNVPKSKTPTLHAIVCKGHFAVGFVEEVRQDGSILVTCTNCQGWNTLIEKDIPAATANIEFTYIQ